MSPLRFSSRKVEVFICKTLNLYRVRISNVLLSLTSNLHVYHSDEFNLSPPL